MNILCFLFTCYLECICNIFQNCSSASNGSIILKGERKNTSFVFSVPTLSSLTKSSLLSERFIFTIGSSLSASYAFVLSHLLKSFWLMSFSLLPCGSLFIALFRPERNTLCNSPHGEVFTVGDFSIKSKIPPGSQKIRWGSNCKNRGGVTFRRFQNPQNESRWVLI